MSKLSLHDVAGVQPGKALLQIVVVREGEGDYGPYLMVTFDIVAHEQEQCIGYELFQICSLTGRGAESTFKLALAAEVLTMEDAANITVDTPDVNIDLEEAVGTIVAAKIVKTKTNGNIKVYDYWPLSDPVVSDWPSIPAGEEGVEEEEEGEEVVEEEEETTHF